MASKYQLEQELQEYENLKANLNMTVENLGKASDDAFKINPSVTANYTINKNPRVVERITWVNEFLKLLTM